MSCKRLRHSRNGPWEDYFKWDLGKGIDLRKGSLKGRKTSTPLILNGLCVSFTVLVLGPDYEEGDLV